MAFESAESRKSDPSGAESSALRRWIPAGARALMLIGLWMILLAPGRVLAEAASDARVSPVGGDLPVLIVTVIDPLDPRLGYMYYRELDAILAALNSVGFIKSGFAERPVWTVDAGTPDGGTEARLGSIDLKRWRSAPGGKRRLEQLKLVLVPETQQGGVDSASLGVALEENVGGGPAYILGPVLSGSAWSLARALNDAGTTHVQIISGSASASNLPEIFERVRTPDGAPKVSFRATVHSAGALARGVRDVLCEFCGATSFKPCDSNPGDAGAGVGGSGDERHHDGYELALLVENSTFYGQRFLQDASKELHALVLPFPAGLADRLGENAFEDDAGVPPSLEPHRGELNVRETRAAVDELLRTLAFEDIRVVGVLATDARDRVVLARKIRRLIPGVRVVLFESDILYSQVPEEEMRGTMVASTYPLFAENQGWTSSGGPGSRRQTVVSDPAQGAYNATLLLLNDMRGGGARTEPPEGLLEFRPPGFATTQPSNGPPVWISVLGARGSWPLVALFKPDDRFLDRRTQPELSSRLIKRAPAPFRGVVLLTVLGAAGLALWLVLVRYSKDDTGLGPDLKYRRFGWTNLVWLSILGATSLILVLQGFILHPPTKVPLTTGVDTPLSIAALALAVFLPTAIARMCVPEPRPHSWVACAFLLSCLFLAAFISMIHGFWTTPPELLALFVVRATHIESGLSPVPPLLLLYVALLVSLFSLLSIRRLDPSFSLVVVKGRALRSPASKAAGSKDREAKPRHLLRGWELHIVLAAVFAAWAWYLWTQFRPMLEIEPIGLIFRVVYALAPLTLSWSFVVVLQTSASLRRALDRIARLDQWDAANTLASELGTPRHLVLAPALKGGRPLRPGRGLGKRISPRAAFFRCWQTAAVLRRRLVRPLFVTPLLVIGLATYPFEPRGMLLLTYGTMLTVFVLGTVVLIVRIENHPGAARLRGADAQARSLDLGFLLRVALPVFPALLTLIGTAMPATGQRVFGAVEQVLSLFK